MKIEVIAYGGWQNNIRLSNEQVELVVTLDIGPRIIRYGFIGGDNAFAEIDGQMGTKDEENWLIRGGHRLWMAPESSGLSNEVDNSPVRWEEMEDGIRTVQDTGLQSGLQKKMEIRLFDDNSVVVNHILENKTDNDIQCAVWALTCMAPRGDLIIPLSPKVPFGADTTVPNQNLVAWPYTDLSDTRFSIGSKYIHVKQIPEKGVPFKFGITHKENWVGYWNDGKLFLKYFSYQSNAVYPDGNVNFESYVGRATIEVESLGPIQKIQAGKFIQHEEKWMLYADVEAPESVEAIDAYIVPKAEAGR